MKLFSRILNLVKSLRLIEPSGGIIVVVLLDRQAEPITLLLILMATLTEQCSYWHWLEELLSVGDSGITVEAHGGENSWLLKAKL